SEVKEALVEARAALLDACEWVVFEAVRRGDLQACCYLLDRLRYTPTRQVEVTDFGTLSGADLESYARELKLH
ncbi:hypothetical protein G3V90_27255, partial [Escherichia coli]|nr:hypothetical protein [Escherichia coli]